MSEREKINQIIKEIQDSEDVSAFIISAIVTKNGQKQLISRVVGSSKYIDMIFNDIEEKVTGADR